MTTFTTPARSNKRAEYLIKTFTDAKNTPEENYHALIEATLEHTSTPPLSPVLNFAAAREELKNQLNEVQRLITSVLRKSQCTPPALAWVYRRNLNILGIFTEQKGYGGGTEMKDITRAIATGETDMQGWHLLRFTAGEKNEAFSIPVKLLGASQGTITRWTRDQVEAQKEAERMAAAGTVANQLATARKKAATALKELEALEKKLAK